MCIYCNTNNYRKIYENHIGPIPKDDDGRTYDIHHKDGDDSNNDPSNLVALTIKEHYRIHESQGDSLACLIMSHRMKISPEEKSFHCKEANRKRVEDGTHNFLDGEAATERNLKRVAEGNHPFVGGEVQRKSNKSRVKNGSHHLLSGDIQRATNKKRMKDGSHNFCQSWNCPHCGKEGKNLATYSRWHGDNCKMANK
jgi:hypothetical protein